MSTAKKRKSGSNSESVADRLDRMLQPNAAQKPGTSPFGIPGSHPGSSSGSRRPGSSAKPAPHSARGANQTSPSRSPNGGTPLTGAGSGLGLTSDPSAGSNSTNPEIRSRELQSQNEALRTECARLQEALELRQTTYARKEQRLTKEISTLKEQLDSLVLARTDTTDQMRSLREMNATIQDGIQSMQGKTRQLVTAHEDELRRSFRAQMHEVERQLAEERQRHMDGAAQYLEQIAQLKSELSWMKDEATRLDTANQKFRQEAQSLRIQYKAQEDDRTMLVRQIAVLKMENARLRDELGKKILAGDANGNAEEGNAASHPHHSTSMSMSMAMTSPTATTMSAAAHPPNMEDQSDIIADMQRRFDETVKRMKKVLETERGHLKQVRAAHVALLADRTELEGFLRACIEDVRQELTLAVGPTGTSNGNLSSPSNGGGMGGNAPAAVWKPADRQRIIEMLLSKERVLALLYEKTFPQKKHLVNRLPAMIGSPNEKAAGSPTRHQPQMSHEEQVLGRLRAFVEVDEEV